MNRIKELRQENNLTLRQLGEELNLKNSTLSQYETGKRNPKDEIWQKIADFFQVPVPYLRGESSPNKIKNISRIYTFKGNNPGGYRFVVLANSAKEAWELIKDRIDMNRNTYGYDNEFVRDIRNYSISSIDLNDAAPQVIEDWR